MASSRDSTVTIDEDSPVALTYENVPERIDSHLLNDEVDSIQNKRLIVAVDFGTTFSCVSYVALAKGEKPHYLALDKIESIQDFPNDWSLNPDDTENQVPTELIYPSNADFRHRENLDTMRNGILETDNEMPGSNVVDLTTEATEDEDTNMDDPEDSNSLLWGYQVHEAWSLPITHSNPNNKPLSRFKLLLDDSPTTKPIRDDLDVTLKSLQKRKVIQKRLQTIADFLTQLLRHTKSQLLENGYDDSWKVEMVLCVPAIWSQKACRDMQTALAFAMDQAGFMGVDVRNNSIENLFIVSEPEAAAAYVLAQEPNIMPGETFVLLDAGGGTVDANTYTISRTTPLRLSREVVAPDGELVGSSFLNEGFRKVLQNLLEDEKYLENGIETINGIIEKIMINEFEYRVKRSFDYESTKGLKQFAISNLRDNDAKGFRGGCIRIPKTTIKEIFMRLLERIAEVMRKQIDKAAQKGCRVTKVILIGGFGTSKSLKTFIKKRLESISEEVGYTIALIKTKGNITTAVASGAVLRAFGKEQGPEREARASYGILRTEPFDPEYIPEHRGLKPSYDHHDGSAYIKDTIDWVLPLGNLVPPVWECAPFICNHTFDCSAPKLSCRELLFVSDRATRSHYRRKHPLNNGAECIGEIVVDFTFLRDRGLLQPIEPSQKANGRKLGKKHYKISYTMVIRVVDRDLKCYAIYDGEIVKKCKINIASAFRPGEK